MAVWAHVCGYRFTQSVFCFFYTVLWSRCRGQVLVFHHSPPGFQCAINWPEGWSEPRHLEPWERVLHADAECRCSSTPSPSSGGHSFPMYNKLTREMIWTSDVLEPWGRILHADAEGRCSSSPSPSPGSHLFLMFLNHEVMSYTLHSSCRNFTPPSSRFLHFSTYLSNRSSVLYIPSRVRRVNRRIRSEFTLFRSGHRCPDDGLETSCGKRSICGSNLSGDVMAHYWRGRNYRPGNVKVISNLESSALFRVFMLYTHTHTPCGIGWCS